MINFNYQEYVNKFIDINEKDLLLKKKDSILEQFNNCEMTGWTKEIDTKLVNRIIKLKNNIKKHSSCLVVIGIGGSFLGSYSVNEMLKKYYNDNSFEIIYAGTTLSSKKMQELLEYLENIDFSLNVISKSGNTLETTITYELLKKLLEKKYNNEEVKKRIIITTDEVEGSLRKEVEKYGYESFIIPNNIGGRYSIVTPAHLFPLAFNIDIKEFINGINEGKKYLNEAYEYSIIRYLLYKSGKCVENYVIYEENIYYFTEWLKQLFGESEGKENKGILPISTIHTRDLHSLGQFIQEGNKIIFETFFKVNESNIINYKTTDIHRINNIVLDSVVNAHYKGNVPAIIINIEKITEFSIGELMYFFMLSAAFSSLLFEVNPFNQPGVEVYKKEVRDNLNTIL